MTLKELYKAIDIDSPKDLEYFEQFAELLEMPGDVDFDLFYMALSEIEPETAGDLTENYFEELMNAVPDEENELVSLLDSIEQNLLFLAENLDKDDTRRSFVQQLFKFREWYTKPGKALSDGKPLSVLEAVFTAREDKLTGEGHTLDFSKALDYELDDTAYGLGSFSKIDITKEG